MGPWLIPRNNDQVLVIVLLLRLSPNASQIHGSNAFSLSLSVCVYLGVYVLILLSCLLYACCASACLVCESLLVN